MRRRRACDGPIDVVAASDKCPHQGCRAHHRDVPSHHRSRAPRTTARSRQAPPRTTRSRLVALASTPAPTPRGRLPPLLLPVTNGGLVGTASWLRRREHLLWKAKRGSQGGGLTDGRGSLNPRPYTAAFRPTGRVWDRTGYRVPAMNWGEGCGRGR
jgi:hypothetical protein